MEHLFSLMEQWLAGLARAHKSPTTVRAHQHALRSFRAWMEAHTIPPDLDRLNLDVLEQYVLFLRDARRDPPLEHRTIRAYIGVIVRWLTWMEAYGKFAGIPDADGGSLKAAAVRETLQSLLHKPEPNIAPRIPDLRRLPAYYELELRRHLQKSSVPTTETPPTQRRTFVNLMRNRALVATIFSTGGRISEVMSLTAKQVQRHGRIATSVKIIGKGKKPRPLRLDATARAWIGDYLAARAPWYPRATALFLSHGPRADGAPLTVRSAELIVKEAALWLADLREGEQADLEEVEALRSVSPHSLRHFLAQAMLDEGADFQDIAPILGHSSSIVTQQVYARLSDERTIEMADTFAPRADLDDLRAAVASDPGA